jgi:hypothetical protein
VVGEKDVREAGQTHGEAERDNPAVPSDQSGVRADLNQTDPHSGEKEAGVESEGLRDPAAAREDS